MPRKRGGNRSRWPLRQLAELSADERRMILRERRKGISYTTLSRRFGVPIVAITLLEQAA